MMNKKLIEINQKVYRDVKSFLQDKETHINSRVIFKLFHFSCEKYKTLRIQY